MAIQQLGLMHYRAPAGSGSDSAYLPVSISASDTSAAPYIAFGSSSNLDTVDQLRIIATVGGNLYTWKTGPNPASDYEVNFIKTLGADADLGNSLQNTWITLGTADIPTWGISPGAGSESLGFLVIRNKNNPSVELANATCGLYADPNT